jgi:hypothetical protein
MATLEQNIRQVNSDFQAIKAKIIEKGVDIADGTRTAEYASKIDEVYEAGKSAGGGGDSDLPSGCRRVDYIKFSGEQIVDTGIICNQDTKIHIIFTRE